MRLLVVGGGVAGAATALAARRVGLDVTVLERRAAVDRDAGSWITLAPNGLDVLDRLGVLDAARAVGWPGHTNRLLASGGRVLGEVPLGTPLAGGSVALTMKRSALSALLVDAAVAAGADLRLGAAAASVEVGTGGGTPAAVLADGSRPTGDVLVGADGVWSRVRRALDPGAPAPRYVGMVNFGGVTADTDWSERLAPGAWHFVFGRHCFTGAFPLTDGRVVWFVNEPRPQVTADERAATSEARWRDHLADLASADVGPAAELVAAGRLELAGDNTHDLARVPTWHGPASVLVGDAVHAPAPSSGQGAAMALEDAAVLVDLLRHRGLAGLPAYEAGRRRRVEGIVRAGARTTSAKMPGPVGRVVRDAFLRGLAASGVMAREVLGTTAHRLDAHLLEPAR
ncbi:FAD-dependent monooxygenase [Phycicoccus sonneratiae]|uniref:FAD-dependent monooxygenase n=1 Tax=Phycicoccus sonneratiae TaxID=2807628 RepID=A0ABS2CMU3_9MICO|nr:FAD-dependent monooxygenase [Phycicoccus sonneraticus]MBM6401211.1 FAD-dependent monooxygenase [Phycicoccus sonneraticus]